MGLPDHGPPDENNIEWQVEKCTSCRRHRLTLRASRAIRKNGLLKGPPPPHTYAGGDNEALAVLSFDGSSKRNDDGSVSAGCGAAVWGPVGLDGRRRCLAQAAVPTPGCNATLAEAWGLAVGYGLLIAVFGRVPKTLIIGDNPSVMAIASAHSAPRQRPGVAAKSWERSIDA